MLMILIIVYQYLKILEFNKFYRYTPPSQGMNDNYKISSSVTIDHFIVAHRVYFLRARLAVYSNITLHRLSWRALTWLTFCSFFKDSEESWHFKDFADFADFAKILKNHDILKMFTLNIPSTHFISIFILFYRPKAQINGPGGNLTKFKEWDRAKTYGRFHHSHYDWWMFPWAGNSNTFANTYKMKHADYFSFF